MIPGDPPTISASGLHGAGDRRAPLPQPTSSPFHLQESSRRRQLPSIIRSEKARFSLHTKKPYIAVSRHRAKQTSNRQQTKNTVSTSPQMPASDVTAHTKGSPLSPRSCVFPITLLLVHNLVSCLSITLPFFLPQLITILPHIRQFFPTTAIRFVL